MPRKTNGVVFELHPGPNKGEDGRPLLYARTAGGLKRTMDDLDDFCANYRHVTKGDMERLFATFLDVAGMWLSQGYRVETPIGSFAMKLKLTGEHTDASRVTGYDIIYGGVEFTPSKDFVQKVGSNREGFRRASGPVGNSQMYDAKAMEEALRLSLKPGFTTVRRFMVHSGLKRDSAQKFLDSLTVGEEARLRRVRDGKTFIYTPLARVTPEEK